MANPKGNPQNLRPFKKGDPRTIAAAKKSKRKPLDEQWREKLQNALGDGDRTTLDAIYGILLKEAKNGNMKAIETLLDRAFGKSKQGIELSGPDGGAIETDNTIINITPVRSNNNGEKESD